MNSLQKYSLAALASAALIAPPALQAQMMAEDFYIKVDAGGTWMQDTDLKSFFGEPTDGARVKFEPGLRLGVGFGYNVTDWFAAELELGGTWNELDEITGADFVDATFGTAPFLVNVKLQLPGKPRVTPYIGAGAGGAFDYLDADPIAFGGTEVWGTESTVVFCAQGFAGLSFRVNDYLSLKVEYRFIYGSEPDFEGDWHDESIKFGSTYTHAVSIAADFRF